jgi:hypothetical protein
MKHVLSDASPFLSMSLELVTAYVVVPVLVLMVTSELPTAVTVPLNESGPPGPPPGGMSSCAFPAWSLSMAVVPLLVTVLKVTTSPTARLLSTCFITASAGSCRPMAVDQVAGPSG